MTKIEITLYNYNELEPMARRKAFDDEYYFLLDNPAQYEDENGNLVDDDMATWKDSDVTEYVEECIEINEYQYFKDGTMANVTHYCGAHEKAGTTEADIHGEIITVSKAN